MNWSISFDQSIRVKLFHVKHHLIFQSTARMTRQPSGTELDPSIDQYQHLTNYTRRDEALHTLRKIGSMVKPIMRQRAWRVGTLAEFYPDQTNLLGLNINGGQKIQVRLRYPGDRNQFLPFEDVLDTMLHELCHNAIGPHNAQFHALWDQLRDEMQSLIRKGYTGEGFLGRGQQLGGRRLPLHEALRLARQAAEDRRKTAERARGSGQRLGGIGVRPGQDARSIIADAVERRIRIERGCASGTAVGDRVANDEKSRGGQVTTTQAGLDDENEAIMMQAYIDLIQEEEREQLGGNYSQPTATNPAGSRGIRDVSSTAAREQSTDLLAQQREIERGLVSHDRKPLPQSRSSEHDLTSNDVELESSEPAPKTKPQEDVKSKIQNITTWTCEICTLVNPLHYLACDACGIERSSAISKAISAAEGQTQAGLRSKSATKLRETPSALKPRSSAYDSIQRFDAERAEKINKMPVGWTCRCGNFMEAEWWTCGRCGRMKETS